MPARDRAALTAALSSIGFSNVYELDGDVRIGRSKKMTIVLDVESPWLRSAPSSEFLNDPISPGDYFAVADEPGKRSFGIWKYDGEAAQRVDVGPGPRIPVSKDADLAKALRSAGLNHYFTVQRLELPPGAFYPGMARPETTSHGSAAFQAPDYRWRERELIASLLQLRSLYQSLEDIFRVVHPVQSNVATFGNSIRDLIILASTECEAQWRAVLKLNKYPRAKPTRFDYQKLGKPMRLSEFTVILPHYRDLNALEPFAGWDGTNDDTPLPWYDDYNAVKHDRAGSFERATLGTALNAVAACWVMIAAQFGYRALRELPDMREKMRIWYAPRWRLGECYFSAGHGFSPDAEVTYRL